MRRSGLKWTNEVAWMPGRWTAVIRDYVYPPAPARIVVLATGPATISISPEQRWLVIQSDVSGWPATRYLGYDAARLRWVWREVISPGINGASAYSTGWEQWTAYPGTACG
jgi:hypothetical protein